MGVPVPDWRVEQIRLTLFPLQDFRQPPPTWWQDVIGQAPATQTIQRQGSVRQIGNIRDDYCSLVLEVKSNRIDWFLNAIQSDGMASAPPSFDSFTGGLAAFRELIVPWVESARSVRRLAVGTVLTCPVDSKDAGYHMLTPLLPCVRLNPAGSSDLIYQINRHASSNAIGTPLHINRISNWSVVRFRTVEFMVSASPTPDAIEPSFVEGHVVRLQLDMNTDAERREALPDAALRPLVDELVAFAQVIAGHGDMQ